MLGKEKEFIWLMEEDNMPVPLMRDFGSASSGGCVVNRVGSGKHGYHQNEY